MRTTDPNVKNRIFKVDVSGYTLEMATEAMKQIMNETKKLPLKDIHLPDGISDKLQEFKDSMLDIEDSLGSKIDFNEDELY